MVRARRSIILAGDARRYGQKPSVRGTAKNANDHPNGGRTRALKLSQTPWARPAKKSRKPRLVVRLKALAKRTPPKPQLSKLDS
jgi:large subunit ribosomal protein L2